MLVASAWSECKVLTGELFLNGDGGLKGKMSTKGSCGGGIRNRNISCLLTSSEKPADMSYCTHLPQLHRIERYELQISFKMFCYWFKDNLELLLKLLHQFLITAAMLNATTTVI